MRTRRNTSGTPTQISDRNGGRRIEELKALEKIFFLVRKEGKVKWEN
jgi:hypothetical protein